MTFLYLVRVSKLMVMIKLELLTYYHIYRCSESKQVYYGNQSVDFIVRVNKLIMVTKQLTYCHIYRFSLI